MDGGRARRTAAENAGALGRLRVSGLCGSNAFDEFLACWLHLPFKPAIVAGQDLDADLTFRDGIGEFRHTADQICEPPQRYYSFV